MKAFSWIEPGDLASAIAAGTQQGALYKAGGVDLADRMKEHLDEPSSLVNLRRLRDLDFVKLEGGVLRLGPLVTLATLATDARIRKAAPALADAAGAAATPQIRNAATLGGNLAQRPRCWYFRKEEFHCRRKGGTECFALAGQNEMHAVFDNDLCAIVHPSAAGTALTALGASLVLRGSSGERTVAADDFFVRPSKDITRETVLGPGELIVEVRVPAGRKSGYVKLMEKQTFDWPLAEAAVALGEDPRVVLGAAAPVPWRARQAEAIVRGRDVDEALAAEAAKAAVAGAKPLEHNGYKLPLLEVAVKRALLLAGGAA
ncbi:MAG TPA: FAD binding domain-containing protein [Myxococcales bacterium]|nr:FAD binding domain-containing protein [Myxococcales bacterium]